jgi:RND family efflux transporter MFP subunit
MSSPRLSGRRVCRAAALAAALALAAGPLSAAEASLTPVKAVTPRLGESAYDLALTGAIEARIQTNVAFQVSGKVTERRIEVGQHVAADDILATLDPTQGLADVANAEAALTSAKALLQQAQQTFDRQTSLLASGYTTRASYDLAQQGLNTAQAQVSAAEAAAKTVREQLSYTDLKAGADGVIVSRAVEAGQVVQAGQTAFVLAQDGPRDAVFEVPDVLLTAPPAGRTVDIALQSDPTIRTTGAVREISPIIDAATSTVTVKVALDATPPGMALGAAVIGLARSAPTQSYALPWSALFEAQGRPAVWVLDDQDRVSLKTIEVGSYGTGRFTVSKGLDGSQRVVTAGVQLLYPGQRVSVVGDGAQ